jgi:hypothetical protein
MKEYSTTPTQYTLSSNICYDDCSYLFHIQYIFWQENENKNNLHD